MTDAKRVSISWVKAIIQTASRAGVSPEVLLQAASVPQEAIEHPSGYLSLESTVEIWKAAQHLSGDGDFGLHMGEQVRPHYFNIVAYSVMNCGTLGEALADFERYQRLISEAAHLAFESEPGFARIVYTPLEGTTVFSRHQIEAVITIIAGFTQWLVGEAIHLQEITFTHPTPVSISEHERIFGCPILFSQNANSMLIESSWMNRPLPGADPNIRKIHQAEAEQRLLELDDSPITLRVFRCFESSQRFSWTREEMAKEMALSTRTLQRYLQQAQTSFKELFDTYQHQHALRLLAQPELTLQEITEKLGFSEPSTFYRAFNRWEGITPGEYRKKRLPPA